MHAQVAAATNRQRDASAVFANANNSTIFPPSVSLGVFNHVVAVVITRPFSPLPSANINSSYLLPLVDLINHSIRGNSRTKGGAAAFQGSTGQMGS